MSGRAHADHDLGGVEFDDIYETWDDELGAWIGILIYGHVDPETAINVAWAHMADYGHDHTLGVPAQAWVRKVPSAGGYVSYHYQNGPGPGATPCTRIEVPSGWKHWCDVPGCRWQFVPSSATTGVPRVNLADGDECGAQPQHRDREYVYLCRDHRASYQQRRDEAVRAAMDALRAQQTAEAAS